MSEKSKCISVSESAALWGRYVKEQDDIDVNGDGVYDHVKAVGGNSPRVVVDDLRGSVWSIGPTFRPEHLPTDLSIAIRPDRVIDVRSRYKDGKTEFHQCTVSPQHETKPGPTISRAFASRGLDYNDNAVSAKEHLECLEIVPGIASTTVQLDQHVPVRLNPGSILSLGCQHRTMGRPLSLNNQFTLTFRASDGRVTGVINTAQNIDHERLQHAQRDAFEVVVFRRRDIEDFHVQAEDAANNIEEFIRDEHQGFAMYWGQDTVPRLLRTIIFVDERFPDGLLKFSVNLSDDEQPNGEPDIRTHVGGTVAVFGEPDETLRYILRHEAAHNLDALLDGSTDAYVLQAAYDRLPKNSPLFSFISEHNYIEACAETDIGHPNDNPGELFASLTTAILEGPRHFRTKLLEFQKAHPEQFDRLHDDLRLVLGRYCELLGDRHNLMHPFYEILNDVTN